MSETYDVTQPALVAISKFPGAVFWRQNCGRFRSMDGRRVINATSVDGIADIMGVYRGFAVAIETKTKTGQQLESQKRFQVAFEKSGGKYIIARSVDDAVSALSALALEARV